jgi:hypothetical protein
VTGTGECLLASIETARVTVREAVTALCYFCVCPRHGQRQATPRREGATPRPRSPPPCAAGPGAAPSGGVWRRGAAAPAPLCRGARELSVSHTARTERHAARACATCSLETDSVSVKYRTVKWLSPVRVSLSALL